MASTSLLGNPSIAARTFREGAIVSLFMVTAYIILGVYPVIVADMVAAGRATLPQLSRIATSDFLSVGLVSLILPRIWSLENVRAKALLGALLSVVGNVWTTWLSGDAIIFARLVAGAGGGILIWLQYAYVARSPRAEALSGIFLAIYVTAAVCVTFGATAFIVPRFGVNGTYLMMAAIGAVTGIAALAGPRRFDPIDQPTSDEILAPARTRLPVAAVLILLSVFFLNASSATVWIYFEPITAAAHISRAASDIAAEASLVFQALGALGAAFAATRLNDRRTAIGLGIFAVLQCGFLMFGTITAFTFTVLAVSVGFVGYAVVPFEISLLISADPSRRSVDMFSAPVVLGSGFGPLMSSLVVSDHDVRGGIAFSFLWTLISLAALLAGITLHRRQRRSHPAPRHA